jgi:5'-methylthioadenosine phosphorylase
MKTLSTNASLSKHITASILGAVHDAVKSGKVGSSAEGSMKYSLMTPHAQVGAEELYRFSYLLPSYFGQYGEPARDRSASRPRIDEDDEVSGSYGVPQGR